MAASTRRALFGGAVAIAAAPLAAMAPFAVDAQTDTDTLRIAAEAERLTAILNRKGHGLSEERWDAMLDEAFELEALVLRAPCTSNRVAAVQLRLGAVQALDNGDRIDGADAMALQSVIAYLEAN